MSEHDESRHLKELLLGRTPSKEPGDTIAVKPQADGKTYDVITSVQTPPTDFRMGIADIVHDLRTGLDSLAYQVAVRAGKTADVVDSALLADVVKRSPDRRPRRSARPSVRSAPFPGDASHGGGVGGDVFHADDQALAQRGERGLQLLQLRTVGHGEQAIDLRQMPVEPPPELRLADVGGPHRLVEPDLRVDERRHRHPIFRAAGRGRWNRSEVFDVRLEDRGKRLGIRRRPPFTCQSSSVRGSPSVPQEPRDRSDPVWLKGSRAFRSTIFFSFACRCRYSVASSWNVLADRSGPFSFGRLSPPYMIERFLRVCRLSP